MGFHPNESPVTRAESEKAKWTEPRVSWQGPTTGPICHIWKLSGGTGRDRREGAGWVTDRSEIGKGDDVCVRVTRERLRKVRVRETVGRRSARIDYLTGWRRRDMNGGT